jgi:hypothetical protein
LPLSRSLAVNAAVVVGAAAVVAVVVVAAPAAPTLTLTLTLTPPPTSSTRSTQHCNAVGAAAVGARRVLGVADWPSTVGAEEAVEAEAVAEEARQEGAAAVPGAAELQWPLCCRSPWPPCRSPHRPLCLLPLLPLPP